MSFGFSVGDFLAAGRLVRDIVTILRTSARAEYQELILELYGLERALSQIERLKAPPGHEYAVNSVKVAALMCIHVLDGFAGKLKRFEVFSSQQTKAGRLRIWKEKLRWGFTMADEVRDLRAYLAAHVGSLNMRLVTEGLSSSYIVAERAQVASNMTNVQVEASNAILHGIQSTLQNVASVLTGEIVPQIKALAHSVSRVWQTNRQIISILIRMQEAPVPTLQYTWFQAPVKFEDPLGRVFPIPSEFDWPKILAIIEVHFDNGLGQKKIAAGEYELFGPLNRQEVISGPSFDGLRPGMSLTLAFVIGKYQNAKEDSRRCPRPGCHSQSLRAPHAGVKECIDCGICFENARTNLPLPYRNDTCALLLDKSTISSPSGKRKRALYDSGNSQRYKQARLERMKFKNIRISSTPLPPTPKVHNVRRVKKSVPRTTVRPGAKESAPSSTRCAQSSKGVLPSPPGSQNEELLHSKSATQTFAAVPATRVEFRKPQLPDPSASSEPDEHNRSFRDVVGWNTAVWNPVYVWNPNHALHTHVQRLQSGLQDHRHRLISPETGAPQISSTSGPIFYRTPSPAFSYSSAPHFAIRYSSSFSAGSTITPSACSEPWYLEDDMRGKERPPPPPPRRVEHLMSSGWTPPNSWRHIGAVKLNSGQEIRDASKSSRSFIPTR